MNCAICHSTNIQQGPKNGSYTLQHCHQCGVEFWNPLTHPGEEFYETSDLHDIKGRRDLQWRHRQFLKKPPLTKGKLLDIGCGTGEFLMHCKQRGFEVCGIDIAARNIQEIKRRYGISQVYQGTIKDFVAQHTQAKFDIITFFEIVEHLADPIDFLNDVKKILNPGGYIVVSVPNAARFGGLKEKEENPPNHLFRWRKKPLQLFLQQEGFINIDVRMQKISHEFFLVRGYFSLGVASKIANKKEDVHGSNQVQKESTTKKIIRILAQYKNRAVIPLAVLLAFPLRLVGYEYWDMYATAQYQIKQK
ncbi:MAG: hypothetical protein RIQ54_48 [Candidatus Parcubacteria bacterium]|jgi:2-polyprenyl-3-methyl-5-hydroxy-6-metoxy-1,4-benzoquinol methylase